jgi:flavin reductase (DIM6/NTAB) family NADH-FMN oxidoreductase RutF
MLHPPTEEIISTLSRLPTASYLLTTAYGDIRDGRIIERVQQCGTNPAMLLVAMEKGHPLSPLIRDSRTFAISLLDSSERHLQRVFGPERRIGEDPFFAYPHQRGTMGAPIVTRCVAWFDCEVVRHLDMETNFELYIGVVHAAGAGVAAVNRLSAAMTIARTAETRHARPRVAVDSASAAVSPSDRPRSGAAERASVKSRRNKS